MNENTSSKPTVVSYCATFLPQEMKHVYRQVRAVSIFRNYVITRTRKNTDMFPYEPVQVLDKSPLRGLRRPFRSRTKGQIKRLCKGELRQIRDITMQQGASLLHLYLGTEAARLIPMLPSLPCPIVVSFHGADVSNDMPQEDLDLLIKCTARFICRSESLRQALLERGAPDEMIRIHRTGVPIPDSCDRPSLRPGEAVRLLQASRFVGKKGLSVTIGALKQLREHGVDARLTLAGDGPLRSELVEQVERLALKDAVDFPGFVSGEVLSGFYSSHHFFLHPSLQTSSGDREGVPNSMLEAMSYGMPVIATAHSGIPEVITHRENGWLINEASPAGLADAIQTLVNDPQLASAIGRKGRVKILHMYSIEAMGRNLEAIYSEVIEATNR